MTKLTRIAAITLVILALGPIAFGQYNANACTANTTAGTYAITCTGFIAPGPNLAQVPMTVLGTLTGDSTGSFSGVVTNSVGGTVFSSTLAGQSSTAPDCTGSITYNKGKPDELNVRYVVLSHGEEVRGMAVDRGSNLACTLVRVKP
jgi:hypothetical protein